jgi:hypothetical protein
MQTDNVMKMETILPEDFDGIFKFTNYSDKEFVGTWGRKQYAFPPNATSPMIIPEHSPLEVQNIRKKFAKELAEREFFKSEKYEHLRSPEGTLGNRTMSGIQTASTYNLDDLTPFIQMALRPLEMKPAKVTMKKEDPLEDKLSRDDDGDLRTKPVNEKESLMAKAQKGEKH